jgi:hypothetical protein
MPTSTLKDLPTKALNQLAHLLQTHPHEKGLSYSERVSAAIPNLPSELTHRSLLSTLLPSTVQTRLCLLHRKLSSPLIHEIFTLVSLEVGHHSNSMMQHNTWLSPDHNTLLQALRELHSLWLPAETYEQTFLEAVNPKWPHQRSGCEGCILTRIGSDLQIVAALRTLLLSRRKTVKPRKGHPKLLVFVDAWVVGSAGKGDRVREVMQGTEMEGEELKIVRKRIWRGEKDMKRRAKGKGVERQNGEVEDDKAKEKEEEVEGQEVYESDFESEIIDHYRALTSTLHKPLMKASTLHKPLMKASPAQTPSLTTGTSAQTLSTHGHLSGPPDPKKPSHPEAPSRTSTNQSAAASKYEPPRGAPAWRAQPTAPKQAAAGLLGIPNPANPSHPGASSRYTTHHPTAAASKYESLTRAPAPTRHNHPTASKQAASYRDLITPPPVQPFPNPKPIQQNRDSRQEYPFLLAPPPAPSTANAAGKKKRQTTWSQFCE